MVAPILVALTACGSGEVVSSNKTFREPIAIPAGNISNWRVSDVRVVIPETLRVSRHPNTRKPSQEIVWWGEPNGDRKKQVARIMETSVRRGAAGLKGRHGVIIEVQVAMFHALTPKARANKLAGRHDLQYFLTVRDAANGSILAKSGLVDSSINAYQGEDATAAVKRGETQKVRITRRIASSVNAWLNSNGKVTRQIVPAEPRKKIRKKRVVSKPVIAPTPAVEEKPEQTAKVVAVANATSGTSSQASECINLGLEGPDVPNC